MFNFKHKFLSLLGEDISTDSAGIGSTGDDTFSGDIYAPDDTRVPFAIGAGSYGKRKKRKKKKRNFIFFRRQM